MAAAMRYIESFLAQAGGHSGTFTGAGISYVIETPAGNLYVVYIDNSVDVVFVKSTDGGRTWTAPTSVFVGTVQALAVWYDRWSNISAGKIHCAYTDSAIDDILYRSIDTENSDNLGTETTIFAGSTAIAGGALTITRARGGNLVVAGSIDAGTEDGAWESADTGATWASAIADPSEAATQDQYLLLPGWNADTQDVMLIFWDASADGLSVKRYDNSANSWAETSIATGMVDQQAITAFPHFAAAVDLANSRNLVVAWSAVDTLGADLRCWIIDDTTITELTNIVLNSTDDQGLCAISILANGEWIVYYAGKTDGSETFTTSVGIYFKVSKDSGSTWGAETQFAARQFNRRALFAVPRCYMSRLYALSSQVTTGYVLSIILDAQFPRVSYQMGVM